MAGPDESWAQGGGPWDDASSSGASTSASRAGPPAGEAEGASPDSLRNTESNIRRLEDAIKHCAARHKYLARTKSPSDGQEVRWYFCKLPLPGKGAPHCPSTPLPSLPASTASTRVFLTRAFRFPLVLQHLISGPHLNHLLRSKLIHGSCQLSH